MRAKSSFPQYPVMKTPKVIRHYCILAVMLLLVSIADWLTTAEVSVGPLYILTIGYGSWNLGKSGGMIAAFVSISTWMFLDQQSGHHYSQWWMIWEQGGVRLITYTLITFGIALYRKTLEAHRRRLAMLEQVLAVCPGCGRIGPQEGGWQRAEDLNKINRDRYTFCPTCISTQNADALAHSTRTKHA